MRVHHSELQHASTLILDWPDLKSSMTADTLTAYLLRMVCIMNWATQQFGQLTPIKCLIEIVRLFFQGTVFHMVVQLLMSLDTVLSRGMIVRNRHAHPSYARYHALTAVPKWARRSKLTGRSADRAQRGGMSSGWWTFWWLKIQYFCTISFPYGREIGQCRLTKWL
jgi:hypothetical protein